MPSLLLRAEGAAARCISLWVYGEHRLDWTLFALLFLAPDLSVLGYLSGKRIGATIHNLSDSYAPPATLAAFGVLGAGSLALSFALIWSARIGA